MAADPRDLAKDAVARADERTTLAAFLQYQRDTLEWKCSGLDAAQMARRSVAPSTMSLLGLVRHLADVERYWFRSVMAGTDATPHFATDGNNDDAFDDAGPEVAQVRQAWAAWRTEVAFATDLVATAPDLEVTGDDRWSGATSLRWVLIHMVEEYGRHNGHADLLRERIDGSVGQ
jgi:uncharacterized damage-inducible protein DinB